MIPVTKSFIPPLEEYQRQVKRAFENGWLTNRGELVIELENEIKKNHPEYFRNYTIPKIRFGAD